MKKITVLMVLAVFSAIIGFSQSKTIVKGKITQTNLYAKDLSASTIVCNTSYIPGTTMDLEFTITINTPDDEYGDSVAMVFPAGFTINSGSDPIAIATQGQGDEALNGIAGQVISWGDNDNSYGGIEPGAHIFLVNVTIGAGVSGDQPIDYFISGDTWGGNPVDASGTCIISQPQPDDVGIIDIITPVTGMNLTATETVQVTVRNFGTNSQSNISVRYRVNGGPPKNGTVPGPIASDGTANFTFTQLADLSAPGVYAIEACTTMPGDDNNNNNCLTDSVTNYGSDIIMGLVRTINTCNSNFYDSGGPAASYQNNENDTVTIYPDIAGMRVKAVFSSFDLESGYDYLYVYDGDNTTAPQITGSPFSGSTVPSALSNLIASNPDGALTFVFISDFSINNSGWEAAISCVAAPSDDLAVLSVIMPDKYVFESSITINAVIKNNGTALKPAGQIVNFKEGAVLLGSSVTNIDLAESEIDTVNYSWNATSGYHLISAEVLPDDDSLNNISSNGIDVFKANWLVESFEGAIFPPADWTDPDTWNQWNNPVNAWHGVQYAYCSTGSTDARLITPILSVTNTDWISFWAFTAAAANFPTIKIQYSVDKVTWLDVSGIIYTLTNTYTRYQEALNLNGNFYFAFVCTNNSGASARMDLVGAPPVYLAPVDAGVIDILSPASGPMLTSSETIQILVQNFGLNPVSNIPVSYSVNGGAPVNEVISVALAPDSTVSYTFSQSADLSVPGTYTVTACTNIITDGNTANDCFTDSVINYGNSVLMGIVDTVALCSGNFYDSGGPLNPYNNNENCTLTIYPSITGNRVSVSFTAFDVETGWDYLYVYDGENTSAPQVSGSPFTGNTIPPALAELIASNPAGALTFVFISDVSVTNAGWEATITCITPPANDLSVVDVIMPDKYVFEGNTSIRAVVRNTGTNLQAAGIPVTFRQGATVYGTSATTIDLSAGETDTVNYIWVAGPAGYHHLTAEAPADDDTTNNSAIDSIDVYKPGTLVESFEGAIFPPADWSSPDTWAQWNFPANAWHGSQYVSCPAGSINSRLITPLLSVTSGDWISFWAFTSAISDFPTFKIQYSPDTVTWTDVSGNIFTLSNIKTRYQENLSLTGNYYFAFVCDNNNPTYSGRMDLVNAPPIYVPPVDVGVIDIISPVSGMNLTAAENVQVTVQNFGSQAQWNIPVYYTINGGPQIIETITDTIVPGAALNYTFAQTADLSIIGGYLFVICTNMPGDADNTNDCITDSIINYGNNIIMGIPSPITTCTGDFYDSGGPSANYNDDENYTLTIIPDSPGSMVQISFTTFDIETGWDFLYVYNGINTSAPQISGSPFTGNTVPAELAQLTASNPSGALTYVFTSDFMINQPGWEATVTCVTPPANDVSVIDIITPVSGPNLTNSEPVEIIVINNGTVTQSNIPVYYVINGGLQIDDIVPGPLAAFESVNFIFSQTADLSLPGIYSLEACTDMTGDVLSGNDCVTEVIENWGDVFPIGYYGTVVTCNGSFTDIGGPTANYPDNENDTIVFIPATAGAMLRFNFTSFNTENNWDFLYVFDGLNTTAPQIAGSPFDGNIIPAELSPVTASNPTGAITFVFTSDVSINRPGWVADITCFYPPVIISQPISQTKCIDETVTFSVSANGNQPLIYQWQYNGVDIAGATDTTYAIASVSVADAGNYTCIISNVDSTVTSNIAVLTVLSPPAITLQPVSQNLCVGQSVTFGVTATGSAPLTYQWKKNGINIPGAISNSYTINPIAASDAGDYTCTVSNTCGNITSSIAMLTVYSPPVIAIQPLGQTVCENENVTFSISVTSAISLSYQWKKDGTDISGATSASYAINSAALADAGDYTCFVSNSCGNITSDIATLTVNSLPLAAITPGATIFCDGGSVVLDANTDPGLIYQWLQNGLIITGATNSSYTVTESGDFSVVITDSNSCSNTSAEETVTVYPLPAANAGFDQGVCPNDIVILSATGGIDYVWDNGVIQNTPFVAIVTTTYTVTVTDNNACTNTDEMTVFVNPTFDATITTTDTVYCTNELPVNLTAFDGGGIWSGTGITDSGNGTFNPAVAGTGQHEIIYTISSGCGDADTIYLNVYTAPVANAGIDQEVCQGTNVVHSATGGISYIWDNGITQDTPFTALVTTTYTVTVADINGCADTDDVLVTVNESPVVDLGAYNQSACEGETITLDAGAGFVYEWSDGSTDQTLAVSTNGIYSVTITDINGCIASDSVDITINFNPVIDLGAYNQSGCAGETITLDAGAGYIYEWSETSVTQTINITNDGIYSVTITDLNGCTGSDSADVTFNINPVVDLGATTQTACEGEIIALDAGAGYVYEWSDGSVTQINDVTANGVYTVTITDINGCTASDSVNAVFNPSPIIDLGAYNQTICAGESITLDAGAGYIYEWSDGSVTQTIDVSSDGIFSATITDENGCTNSDSVMISVSDSIILALTTIDASCNGFANGSADLTVSGGLMPYIFDWSNGETTEDINSIAAGIYNVTVTDANYCSSTGSVTITEPAELLAAIITTTDVLCFGDTNGSATVEEIGGTPPYSYLWTSGETTITAINLPAGIYCITVTDSNGCTKTECVVIGEPAPLDTVSVTTTEDDGGCNGSAFIVVTGGTSPYTYIWSDGGDGQNLCYGTYSVTITDANGCILVVNNIYIGLVSIPQITNNSPIRIYPNPTKGIVYIFNAEKSKVFVYNILGELITTVDNDSSIKTIDISDKSKGIYFVKINIGSDVFNEKILYEIY